MLVYMGKAKMADRPNNQSFLDALRSIKSEAVASRLEEYKQFHVFIDDVMNTVNQIQDVRGERKLLSDDFQRGVNLVLQEFKAHPQVRFYIWLFDIPKQNEQITVRAKPYLECTWKEALKHPETRHRLLLDIINYIKHKAPLTRYTRFLIVAPSFVHPLEVAYDDMGRKRITQKDELYIRPGEADYMLRKYLRHVNYSAQINNTTYLVAVRSRDHDIVFIVLALCEAWKHLNIYIRINNRTYISIAELYRALVDVSPRVTMKLCMAYMLNKKRMLPMQIKSHELIETVVTRHADIRTVEEDGRLSIHYLQSLLAVLFPKKRKMDDFASRRYNPCNRVYRNLLYAGV